MDDKQISVSNPFSTGGGGVHFETRVQATYVILMLTGGFAPCFCPWPITKIKLQGKYEGYNTDDLIVFTTEPEGKRERKLLAQIKHKISITENNKTFKEVIRSAWKDFTNPDFFNPNMDAIALITGPLATIDIDDTRMLMEWARTSGHAQDFLDKVELANFSNEGKRKKLKAFRVQLDNAKGESVTDEEFWGFLKSFHLLGYDLDVKKGVALSLLHSVIGRRVSEVQDGVWEKVLNHVQYVNQHAGMITPDNIPDEICKAFEEPFLHTIPREFLPTKPTTSVSLPDTPEGKNTLSMALMIGEWDDNAQADIKAIEALTERPYKDWVVNLREILYQTNSPLSFYNGKWKVQERLELWHQLGARIFDEHLERFQTVALTVLRERNPALDLKPEERYAASIHNKVLKHSCNIRRGIAATLAILGNHEQLFTKCTVGRAKTTALLSVRNLLRDANWETWISINPVTPLLAEAAPEEFLSIVEHALQDASNPFTEFFSQECNGTFGSSYISTLLWALESLAWEPAFLVRITAILGKLASIDPGGVFCNRPSGTLVTIFLPWFPQTLAPISTRKTAIEVLLRDFPSVAWKLLLALLTGSRKSSMGSHKPEWRSSIPENHENGVTHAEYWEQIDIYSAMVVELAKNAPDKLLDLTEHIDKLPDKTREKFLTHLASTEMRNVNEELRTKIWEQLLETAVEHERFSDKRWALPPSVVAEIKTAANAIAPTALTPQFKHLFVKKYGGLLNKKGSFEEQQTRLRKRQGDAIQQILQHEGFKGVIDLVRKVEFPARVGWILGELAEESTDAAILPSLLVTDEKALRDFAGGFVRKRFDRYGWAWVDALSIDSWTVEQRGQFLAYLPFESKTWTQVTKLLKDNESAYWTNQAITPYGAQGDLTPAIKRLLDFEKVDTALVCLTANSYMEERINPTIAVDVLSAISESSFESGRIDHYDIIHIIEKLQKCDHVTSKDLENLEWKFLPFLTQHNGLRPLTLERQLAQDPAFFCDAIQTVYKSKLMTHNASEVTEEKKRLALLVSRLLDNWTWIPGLNNDGTFDEGHFNTWLSEVKAACAKSGHLNAALAHIGKVLKYSPKDPDGLWLLRPVAEALNAPDVDSMRNGFQTEIFNSRGVFTFTGGKEERKLAEKYEKLAQEIEEYHRLAAELRCLAAQYERQAEHDEIEASLELE